VIPPIIAIATVAIATKQPLIANESQPAATTVIVAAAILNYKSTGCASF
jgi:hypothetical protein